MILKQAADNTLELLNAAERQRLDQIAFQLRAADALYREDVSKQLGLDEQQRTRVLEIRAGVVQAAKKLAADRKAHGGGAKEFAAALDKLNAQAREDVIALLTEEQRARLAEMQGPPLAFSRADLKLSIRSAPAANLGDAGNQ